MQAMIRRLSHVDRQGRLRPLWVSLPLIEVLLDGAKYFRRLPPARAEVQPIYRPKVGSGRLVLATPVKPPPQPGPKRTRTPWYLVGSRKPASATLRPATPADPLAHHLARKHIDQAQYLAGREFQKHTAGSGPASQKWLARCTLELGQDGFALVRSILIDGKSTREIAEARGMSDEGGQRYYARRFFLCLAALAEVFGFASLGPPTAEPKPTSHPPSSLGGP